MKKKWTGLKMKDTTKTGFEMVSEIDIRSSLKKELSNQLALEEYQLAKGKSRIDILVINKGKFIGYEIKSDFDTLTRLPNQSKVYNKICNEMYLCIGEKLCDKALSKIPDWWGVVKFFKKNGKLSKKQIRHPKQNKQNFCLKYISNFLWRDECLKFCESLGLEGKFKYAPKYEIVNYICEHFSYDIIKDFVVNALTSRHSSLTDQPQMLYDGLDQL